MELSHQIGQTRIDQRPHDRLHEGAIEREVGFRYAVDRREAALVGDGTPMSKDFSGELVLSEITPVRRWEHGATLYSLGQAPMVLHHDGILFFRTAKEGHVGSDDTVPLLREDSIELRFAFYGNTGPHR